MQASLRMGIRLVLILKSKIFEFENGEHKNLLERKRKSMRNAYKEYFNKNSRKLERFYGESYNSAAPPPNEFFKF